MKKKKELAYSNLKKGIFLELLEGLIREFINEKDERMGNAEEEKSHEKFEFVYRRAVSLFESSLAD